MNNHENPAPAENAPSRKALTNLGKRKGVALIIVISFVVLLSALVVGFFSRVTTDLSSSRSYAEGVTVRQLADSAVGVVMGQIREATTTQFGCWASQPGMIRVYREAGGPGPSAYRFFKLYSSHDLIVSDREFRQFDPTLTDGSGSSSAVEVPLGTGGWADQPAYFVDINEPVDVPDPAAGNSTRKTVKRYPIIDPSIALIYENERSRPKRPDWTGKVEGFEIALPSSDQKVNQAPMPVRWIYVLKDGTLTAPPPLTSGASGDSGLKAIWTATGADGTRTGVPTKDNPIVGRIAFWTDDDTCKVNINTAGGFVLPDGINEAEWATNPQLYRNPTARAAGGAEKNPGYYHGSFWDTPRVQTYFDRGINNANVENYRGGLSNSQPGQNEFQRYPGHPSTTSLGLIMQNLLPRGRTGLNSEKLYAITPRLTPGGSKGGTVRLETKFDEPLQIKAGFEAIAARPQTGSGNQSTQSYHLHASVDEFFWTSLNGPRISAVDAVNQWASQNGESALSRDSITPTLVDKMRFFLTAHSRAPETNLFGRPRIAVWPVPSAAREATLHSNNIRNAKDDLIRFCATVGRDPRASGARNARQGEFIFERQNPNSATFDFNIPRNTQIFQYLRDLTSSTRGVIPGFGGSFERKYSGAPGGRDQILVEIFDYIRTVNQKDSSREKLIDEKFRPNTTASALATADTNSQLKAEARYAPHALVVPTRVTLDGKQLAGLGRYPTISEASLVFYHAGYLCRPKKNSPLANDEPPQNGAWARSPGNNSEAVIYDLEKSPVDTANLESEWVKTNVEEWTGQLIRAFLIFETFNPMQGYAPVDNTATISMTDTTRVGSDQRFPRYTKRDPQAGTYVHELSFNGQFSIRAGSGEPQQLQFGRPGQSPPLSNRFTRTSGETWGGRNFGGTEGFFHTISDDFGFAPTAPNYYVFQTPCADPVRDGMRVAFNDTQFNFQGGEMELSIRYQDTASSGTVFNNLIQRVKLNFRSPAGAWPLPKPVFRPFASDPGGFDYRGQIGRNADSGDSWQPWSTFLKTRHANNPLPSGWAMPYNLPSRIAWSREHGHAPWTKFDKNGKQVGDGYNYGRRQFQILQPGDVIRSLVPGGENPIASDPRLAAIQQVVTTFQPHPDYDSMKQRAETLRMANGTPYFDVSRDFPRYAEPPESFNEPTTGFLTQLPAGTRYRPGFGPDLPKKTKSGAPFIATRADGQTGDFDTGIGNFPDGAFANKADEGNVAEYWQDIWGNWNYVEPYFSTWIYDPPLDTYFSPNRQIPGPVMFGSLPAPQDTWDRSGWKTLLFCPNPAGQNHPGAQAPHDHLLLDLFSMPVIEPYAISEPFSTAGKVNLNYQMVPFTYIKRTSALRAALHPLRVTAIPQTFTRNVSGGRELKYKGVDNVENLRYLVDREETLKAFDAFFLQYRRDRNGGFFKSATQICERFLYPQGQTVDGSNVSYSTGEAGIRSFWDRNLVTGDNVREKPYADLYPRITTKSNTFTIHYRVQTLRQRPFTGRAADADAYYRTFDESRDQVLSEYRGQTTIERYLDPEDPRFRANYQPAKDRINVETQSLEEAYRFRVIANKRFSPW